MQNSQSTRMTSQPSSRRNTEAQSSEKEASAQAAVITFGAVVKGFGGRKVLDDISFDVQTGEALCILGRSGSGKSVMLRLIIGLMKADQGKVMVLGEDVAAHDRETLSSMRRKMGFLFQSAGLFSSFSLKDNLAIPMQRLRRDVSGAEIKDAVEEALRRVGLENDGNKMPSELSGGMQKRAGLARALVLKPEILLVDEPSSGLDRITAGEIDDLLLEVKTQRHATMVIVTHDIHGAKRLGDKFAVLDECKLLAFGSPKELDERQDEHLNQFISETGR